MWGTERPTKGHRWWDSQELCWHYLCHHSLLNHNFSFSHCALLPLKVSGLISGHDEEWRWVEVLLRDAEAYIRYALSTEKHKLHRHLKHFPAFETPTASFYSHHVEGSTLDSGLVGGIGRQGAVQWRPSLFLWGETVWKRVHTSCHLYLWWFTLEEECGRLR